MPGFCQVMGKTCHAWSVDSPGRLYQMKLPWKFNDILINKNFDGFVKNRFHLTDFKKSYCYRSVPGLGPGKAVPRKPKVGVWFLKQHWSFTEKFSKCRSVKISNCLRPTGRVFEISAKAFDESRKRSGAKKLTPTAGLPSYEFYHTGKTQCAGKSFLV